MRLEVFRGSEARRALDDRGFQGRWRALHRQCPWSTVFQDVGFATIWYRVYRDVYDPIVAVGSEADGSMSGLFLLARERGTGALAHVGEKHAEYQTWIARPDRGAFIGDALDALKPHVGGATLQLRYAPSRLPLETLTSSQSWGWRTVSWLEERGIADLEKPDGIASLIESSRYRYRMRRIGALGEISFRTVTTRAELEAWLDEIIAFCDLRQGAINGAFPFHDDPLKRELHLAMLDAPELLHTTILTAGKTLISSQINFVDRRTISLGLISHSPMQGKISPGTLHLLLLARHAAAQGFAEIDLTPGGEYKDRFASFTDPTRVVSIQFSATQAVRAQVRRFAAEQAKTRIRELGLEPVAVKKQFVQRVADLRRSITGARGRANGSHAESAAAELMIFRIPSVNQSSETNDVSAMSTNDLRIDEVGDLLLPTSSGRSVHERRDEFRAALSRFERGAQLITRTDGGRITHQAWVLKGPGKAHLGPTFADYEVSDRSMLVHGVVADEKTPADDRFLDQVSSLTRARHPGLELLVAAPPGHSMSDRLSRVGQVVDRIAPAHAATASAEVAADQAAERQPAS
jgi:CelD/BcsL family acetyltransferase involved in cellulose biosynthesis